jgi:hypothetical protein
MNRAWEWARSFFTRKTDRAAVAPNIDFKRLVPDLPTMDEARSVGTRPTGLGRVPGLGRLFDPRANADTAAKETVVAHAYLRGVGKAQQQLIAKYLSAFKNPFATDGRGVITNVKTAAADAPLHIADFYERWERDPGAYHLSPEQAKFAQFMINIVKSADFLFEKHRPDVDPMQPLLTGMEPTRSFQFPRPTIDKLDADGNPMEVTPQTDGGRIGARMPFEKRRLYETEAQGSKTTLYEPDMVKRVVARVGQVYKALADDMLVNDPSLGGKTPAERLPIIAEMFKKELLAGEMTQADVVFLAQHPFLGKEGTVNEMAFSGQIFSREVADILNAAYKTESHPLFRGIQQTNAFAKAIRYGLDVSWAGIQMSYAAVTHPVGAAKGAWGGIEALWNPKVVAESLRRPENMQAARELAHLGVTLGRSQDFMMGLEKGQIMDRIPVLNVGARLANRSFQASMDMATISLWRALSPSVPKSAWPQLAEYIQNMTFRARTMEAGMHPGRALAEQVVFTAPNMYRAAVNLMARPMTEGNTPVGRMAAKDMAIYVTGMTALIAGYGMAMGLSPEEIKRRLNPSEGVFMSLPVPVRGRDGAWTNVGFGGPLRAVMRLLGGAAKQAVENPQRYSTLNPERNDVSKWVRGRLAPLPSVAVDNLIGRDYMGRDVNVAESSKTALTPMTLDRLMRPADEEQQITGIEAVPEITGLMVYGDTYASRKRRFLEETARKEFGKPYESLPLRDQARLQLRAQRDADQGKYGLRSPVTGRQTISSYNEAAEKKARLSSRLTPEIAVALKKSGVDLVPSDNYITLPNGKAVNLTAADRKRLEVLTAEEYRKVLPQFTARLGQRTVPLGTQQDVYKKAMTRAREIAERRLMQEVGRSREPQPRLSSVK